jgi:hypothetical protein
MPRWSASSTAWPRVRRRWLRAARGEVARRLAWTPTTLYVGTDFGPGSMTDSGYPRILKRWRAARRWPRRRRVARAGARRLGRRVADHHARLRAHADRARLTFFTNEHSCCATAGEARGARRCQRSFMHSAGVSASGCCSSCAATGPSAGRSPGPKGSLLAAGWSLPEAGERRFEVLFEPDRDAVAGRLRADPAPRAGERARQRHATGCRNADARRDGAWRARRSPGLPEFGT